MCEAQKKRREYYRKESIKKRALAAQEVLVIDFNSIEMTEKERDLKTISTKIYLNRYLSWLNNLTLWCENATEKNINVNNQDSQEHTPSMPQNSDEYPNVNLTEGENEINNDLNETPQKTRADPNVT